MSLKVDPGIDPLALEVANEINEELRCKTATWEHEDLAQVTVISMPRLNLI